MCIANSCRTAVIHRTRANRRRRDHAGNVLIEMAFVLPVLLFISFGMIEFGQFFYIRSAFEAAARDVARAACLSTAQQTDPTTRATSTLAQANVTFNSSWMTMVDVTASNAPVANCAALPIGDKLLVTIKCPYNQIPNTFRPLYAMTGQGIGSGKTCSGQCEMIKE